MAARISREKGAWQAFAAEAGKSTEWVTYAAILTPRSAQTTAWLMRRQFPDLEIRQSKGVITARLDPVIASGREAS